MSQHMSRRRFIRLSALGITGVALAACGATPTATPLPPPPTATKAPAAPAPTSVPPTATKAPAAPAPTSVPPTATKAPAAPTPTVAAKKVTLKIMHNWAPGEPKGPPLTSVFKDVMAQNPEITIQEEVFTDSDIPTKVEVAFKAKEEPDVVFINWFMSAPTWTENGLTVPIDDIASKWGLKDAFLEPAIKQFTNSQGKLSAFPLEGFHWPMWYNTKILKQAGVEVPKTLAELLAAIPKIKAAGFAPIGAGVKDSQGWAFFALVLATMVDDATHLSMYKDGKNWDKAAPGIDAFVQIRDAKAFSDAATGFDLAGALAEFGAGKTAMLHGGSWSYATLPKEMGADVALAGFPLPPKSVRKMPLGFAGFSAKGVWITRNGSAKLDAIEKLVKYLYQPKIIARFVEQAAMIPPLKAEVPVDASKVPPLFVQSLKVANSIEWASGGQGNAPATVRPNLMTIVQEAYVRGTTKEITDKILAAFKAIA